MGAPPLMGGPPMGMHPDAANELAELERTTKAREEKEKKKEVEHLTHKMREDNRNQGDNESCASVLLFWGILNALLWVVPLLGDSWWTKIWHGLGLDKLVVTVGLFNMEVYVDCTVSDIGGLCASVKKYADHNSGHWTMLEFQNMMCDNWKPSCATVGKLYGAGWIPLCMLPVCAALEVLAILLLYFYWHGKPTATVRNLANKCGALAPFCGALGLSGWMLYSPYLQELPRWWAAEANTGIENNALFGLKESFTLPAGWCCLVAFFTLLSSGIRFFIQFTLPEHVNEPDIQGFDESSRLIAEAEKLYDNSSHA